MSLFTLSTETIIPILKFMLPNDIDNVAMTCKAMRRLCHVHLPEHQERKQQYGHLKIYTREAVPHSSYSSPTTLMHTILQEPRVACYPRTLEFIFSDEDSCHSMSEADWNQLACRVRSKEKELYMQNNHFETQILSSPYFEYDPYNYYAVDRFGPGEEVEALLLTVLCSLEHLIFRNCKRVDWDHIRTSVLNVANITRGRVSPFNDPDGDEFAKYRTHSHTLSKLKSVTFEDPDRFDTSRSGPYIHLEPIVAFAQIPSLRKIVVRNFRTPYVSGNEIKIESSEDYFEDFLDSTENEDDATPLPFSGLKTLDAIEHRPVRYTRPMDKYRATSNVQSLTLHSCDPDEITFIPLLGTIIALRSFEFSRLCGYEGKEAFSNLLAALIEHAGHSLEDLTLRTHGISKLQNIRIRPGTSVPTRIPPSTGVLFQFWGDIGSLKGFTQLTKLTLDAEYLIDEEYSPVRLLHLLPASLEILRLGHIDNVTAELKSRKKRLAYGLLQDLSTLPTPLSDLTDPEHADIVDDKRLEECSNSFTNKEEAASLAEILLRYPGEVRVILDRLDEIQDDCLRWLDLFFECAVDVSEPLPKLREVVVETRDKRVATWLEERFAGTRVVGRWVGSGEGERGG